MASINYMGNNWVSLTFILDNYWILYIRQYKTTLITMSTELFCVEFNP